MATEQPAQQGWTTHTQPSGAGGASLEQMPAASGVLLTDAGDSSLRELRRRVVDPVVASVMAADEIGAVLVYRHLDQPEIRARVTATNGEVSEHYLWLDPVLPHDLSDLAQQFASELEDFVAESRFGWGQQRTARFVIAEPFVPPRFQDYLTEPPRTDITVAHPAPDPGFIQDAVLMPLSHGKSHLRWRVVWAITATQYEEFEGSKDDCVKWALDRCNNVRAWSDATQDLEPVLGAAP